MLSPTIVLHMMLLAICHTICDRTLHLAPSLGPWTARGGVAAVMALAYAKRRLRGKQPAPAVYVVDGPALQAIADEGWSELTALDEEKRKKHMHFLQLANLSFRHVPVRHDWVRTWVASILLFLGDTWLLEEWVCITHEVPVHA